MFDHVSYRGLDPWFLHFLETKYLMWTIVEIMNLSLFVFHKCFTVCFFFGPYKFPRFIFKKINKLKCPSYRSYDCFRKNGNWSWQFLIYYRVIVVSIWAELWSHSGRKPELCMLCNFSVWYLRWPRKEDVGLWTSSFYGDYLLGAHLCFLQILRCR